MNPLDTDLAGVHLATPLMLASGDIGESAGSLAPFQRPAVGAVVTRTLRKREFEGRRVPPSPSFFIGAGGQFALNSEWGSRADLGYWLDGGLAQAAASGPVIVSVSGRDIEDCAEVCAGLPRDTVQLVELNVSCSHSGEIFGRVGEDPAHVSRMVGAVRAVWSGGIIVKLGLSPGMGDVAAAAEEAGAAAISTTNSIGPGLDIDPRTRRPVLGLAGGIGGMSGRAVFPLALRAVACVAGAVRLPVIGVGGIATSMDVVKMLMVGATCVQVYTEAALRGPALFDELASDLTAYLAEQGLGNVSELVGISRPYLDLPTNVGRVVPVIDPDRCRPCARCGAICAPGAITVTDRARVDAAICTGCGACVDVCPPDRAAISSAWRPVL
jgi:dihydroorotate dehydrogenase (NAD+) catalytic subunit